MTALKGTYASFTRYTILSRAFGSSIKTHMNSPHYSLTHRAAVPSYLMNGKTHTAHSSSPLRPSTRTSVNAEEREKLTASILSSNARRQPVDLDSLESSKVNGHEPYPSDVLGKDSVAPTKIDVSARDPRDEAPSPTTATVSRPHSPYTLNPPIDFDGLSWPSESTLERGCKIMLKEFPRSWDKRAPGSFTSAG